MISKPYSTEEQQERDELIRVLSEMHKEHSTDPETLCGSTFHDFNKEHPRFNDLCDMQPRLFDLCPDVGR
jgi:hypothetical protein